MQQFIEPNRLPIFIWEYDSPHIFYGFSDLGNGIKIAPHHEGQPIHPDSLSAADWPQAKYTTVSLTMDELLNERGREFADEMLRREDLICFGKFENAWWDKEQDADKHYELFPILQTVLTSNPALKQNPGY